MTKWSRWSGLLLVCVVIPANRPPAPLLAQPAAARTLQLLPDGLLYPVYRGGAKEARLSGSLLFDAEGATYLDAALGGRFGILRYASDPMEDGWAWQADVEAAVYPRLNLAHVYRSMESADFRFGVPLTARRGSIDLKVGYYHLSSHIGDEFLERNKTFVRVNYVREAGSVGFTYRPTAQWTTYTEVGYAIYVSGGAEPWEIQLGTEYAFPIEDCSSCGGPFVAVHGHLREEANFGGTLHTTAGWEWRGENAGRYLRVGLEYRGGKSSQLEFFDQDEQLFGIGIQLGP